MLIGAYGMFWQRHEVDWQPGSGPSAWRLLGRHGQHKPKLRLTDFRKARGVYILFDDFGAYYTGLAKGAGGLGERLKIHTADKHKNQWDRFCWFSFDSVSKQQLADGTQRLVKREKPVPSKDASVIRELEALLITVLGTRRQNKMKFENADCWEQVGWYETEKFCSKVADD